MSGMMMHGLGDCTPELNCGCIGKPPDVLRERIAQTVRAHRPGASIVAYTCMCGVPWTSEHVADAVIAALGLTEETEQGYTIAFNDDERALHWHPRRRYVTPWERIEEDQ